MVQIDIPMAFGLGSFFAGAVRDKIEAGDDKACWRALAKSFVFQCLFVFWLPLWLLVNYFGFQTTHMWWHGDSLADYPWLLPGFFLLYFVSHILGFALGVKLVKAGKAGWTNAIFAGGWLLFIGWVAAQPQRQPENEQTLKHEALCRRRAGQDRGR